MSLSKRRGGTGFACLAVLTLWLSSTALAGAAPAFADIIVVGGKIRTEDSVDSVAEALAIRRGRILAVGTEREIRALARPSTRIIDLHGLTATPGLIETHAHLADGGMDALRSVDLSDSTSIAAVRAALAAKAKSLAPGAWLLGAGWDEGKLGEGRYLRASDLDDLAPGHPIWLEHTTGHYGTANHRALELAGITGATADPPAGTIERDAAGEPTGVLKEAAQERVQTLIPLPTPAEWREAILANVRLMHREGMTAVKDADIRQVHWDAYASLAREHRLDAHVCVLWHSDPSVAAARALAAHLAQLARPPRTAAENLMSCGVKTYMDGSGGARTAWMYDDWHRDSTGIDVGNKGYPVTDPGVYREMVGIFHAAGLTIGTHAIGDRAIDWVVDSYAAALAARPTGGLRHTIIHANTPSDHAIDVMADLEKRFDAAYPEPQAEFLWWLGDNYTANLGPDRSARLNPLRSYVRRGILFGGGSDYPVTPLPARYGLWASVARETLRGTWGRQPFGTQESLTPAEALRSYTRAAAHLLFLDREAGSLETGKSADLAVWDVDPAGASASELKNLHCELTLFRGRIVHHAPGSRVEVR